MKKREIHTLYLFILLLFAGLIYIIWRMLFTLNLLTSPFATFWSWALLFAEFITLIVFTNYSMILLKAHDIKDPYIDNKLQHDYAKDIYNKSGELVTFENFLPSVAIFICTYNEPLEILASTTIGANNINYPNKQVYILDDGHREDVKELAKIIGVNYITREKNTGFKAGNINNALNNTESDLVAIFDSDHIPVATFLRETVYLFTDKEVALVQTPQKFGNLDPIQKNMNMPRKLGNEQDMFYKLIEPALHEYNSVFCGGTNIIIKRDILKKVGNFPTTTITEDSLLGLIFHSEGYKVIYYNRALAIGLAPISFDEYIKQRKRWAKGNLQIIKNSQNWQYYKSLNNFQRFFYLTSVLYFMTPIVRLILFFTPIYFLLFDISALFVTFYQIVLFQIVYFSIKYMFLFSERVQKWNIILADVYDIINAVFILPTILKTIFIPEKLQKTIFRVTSKENKNYSKNIYYKSVLYLLFFILILAQAQGISDLLTKNIYSYPAVWVNLFWNTLNIISVLIAAHIAYEKPDKRKFIRFKINKPMQIQNCKNTSFEIFLANISRDGLRFTSKEHLDILNNCLYKIKIENLELLFDIATVNGDCYNARLKSPIMFYGLDRDGIERLKKFIKFAFSAENVN